MFRKYLHKGKALREAEEFDGCERCKMLLPGSFTLTVKEQHEVGIFTVHYQRTFISN